MTETQATQDDGQVKPSNPKDLAAIEECRVDFTLIPLEGLVAEATAFKEGDIKYGGHNYVVSGVSACVYVGAALRHIYKYLWGEVVDPVTKVHHLGSAKACLGVLLAAEHNGFLNDDRPPKTKNVSGLFETTSTTVKHLYQQYPEHKTRWTQNSFTKFIIGLMKQKQEQKKEISP